MLAKYILFSASLIMMLAQDVTSYCDTSAKSRRDCELCKVSLQDANETVCTIAEGPCFWVDTTDPNPYTNWTNANCTNGGGGSPGGDDKDKGGDGDGGCKGGPKKCGRLRG